MFHEVRIIGEIVVLAMFEDEDAIILQKSFLEDEVGDFGEFFQGVRRVSEDEVKLLLAGFDISENVSTQWCHKRTLPL